MQIVDKSSARLGLSDSIETLVAIAENHSNICKFDNVHDGNYKLVIGELLELVQLATTDRPRLSVPLISVQDAQSVQSRPSVTSLTTQDSFSEDSAPSSRIRFQMPSWSDAEPSLSSNREPKEDLSMQNPHNTLPTFPVFMIPYNENPRFIGRDEVLKTAERTLQSRSSDRRRVALYGLGGVGFVFHHPKRDGKILMFEQQQITNCH